MAKVKPKAADPARPSDALPAQATPPAGAAQDPLAGTPSDPVDTSSESTETQAAADLSTGGPAEALPPAAAEVSPEQEQPAPKPKLPERIRKRPSRQDRLAELHRLAGEQAAREGLDVEGYVTRIMAAKLGREDLVTDDLTHEPSETYCTLNNHNDGDPRPCVHCRHCNQKLRPRQLTEACPAR